MSINSDIFDYADEFSPTKEVIDQFLLLQPCYFAFQKSLDLNYFSFKSFSKKEKIKESISFIFTYRYHLLFSQIYDKVKNSQTEKVEINYLPDNFVEVCRERLWIEEKIALSFFLSPLKHEIEEYLNRLDKKFVSIKKFDDDLFKCEVFIDKDYFLKIWEDFKKNKIENEYYKKKLEIFYTSVILPLAWKIERIHEVAINSLEKEYPFLPKLIEKGISILSPETKLKKISYKEENGYGYLTINNKKIKVGKVKTVKCIFLRKIINECRGHSISVEEIYLSIYYEIKKYRELTNLEYLSPIAMIEKLKNNIVKEIHKILQKEGINGFIKAVRFNKETKTCRFDEDFLTIS